MKFKQIGIIKKIMILGLILISTNMYSQKNDQYGFTKTHKDIIILPPLIKVESANTTKDSFLLNIGKVELLEIQQMFIDRFQVFIKDHELDINIIPIDSIVAHFTHPAYIHYIRPSQVTKKLYADALFKTQLEIEVLESKFLIIPGNLNSLFNPSVSYRNRQLRSFFQIEVFDASSKKWVFDYKKKSKFTLNKPFSEFIDFIMEEALDKFPYH